MRPTMTISLRIAACLTLVACTHAAPPPAAPAAPAPLAEAGPEWGSLRNLVGTWEGTDPDRRSTGRFTLAAELGGKVLVRHNVGESPEGHREDLMVIFHGPASLRASYFDSEGHVIGYTVTAAEAHIEMLSDEVAGMPRFRLTYDVRSGDELAIDFAIAMPGQTEFQHYTGGIVHRVH